MQRLPRLVLISGLPAAGKTTFGDWLHSEHGYLHLDLELRDCLVVNGLPQFWPERIWNLDAQGLAAFVAYLRSRDTGTIMTWAFHTDLIPFVADMVQLGCEPWWFEADRLASRKAHRLRKRLIRHGTIVPGEPDMQRYDVYVASLVHHWGTISPIFADNIIRTLHADDSRLSCAAIWNTIVSSQSSTQAI